jgi:hypothetical protein
VLFEPGQWCEKERGRNPPPFIPAPNRDHFATPVGLLFNELCFSPHSVIQPISTLLDFGLKMDTGKFSSSTGPLILYLILLSSRVTAFVNFIVHYHNQHQNKSENDNRGNGRENQEMAGNENDSQEMKEESLVGLPMSSSFVRGLKCSDKVIGSLRTFSEESRVIFLHHIIPMLERWASHAVRAHPLSVVCALHFHISLLLNVLKDEDLDENLVTLHITAHILMSSHYPFQTDPISGRSFSGEKPPRLVAMKNHQVKSVFTDQIYISALTHLG